MTQLNYKRLQALIAAGETDYEKLTAAMYRDMKDEEKVRKIVIKPKLYKKNTE